MGLHSLAQVIYFVRVLAHTQCSRKAKVIISEGQSYSFNSLITVILREAKVSN